MVLSIVARIGPCTPFDMKKSVERCIGFFWSFPHSQLYAEPSRLTDMGLLSEYQEPTGRRRRLYTITERGRARLAEWWHTDGESIHEIRDSGLLKLYFGNLTSVSNSAEVAAMETAAHQERLDRYRKAYNSMIDDPERDPLELRTLEFGLRYEALAVEFWHGTAEQLGSEPQEK
ncbi:PadR family transcriptional regulator [Nocardia coubleae]|uniref:PadR family transcriptional regulator n=1 Tax=Nocardia coubleae TaxID=356147 RepID=UPI00248060AB|nr:PadR family transcriptional regulator [Nocardia coubleae]